MATHSTVWDDPRLHPATEDGIVTTDTRIQELKEQRKQLWREVVVAAIRAGADANTAAEHAAVAIQRYGQFLERTNDHS